MPRHFNFGQCLIFDRDGNNDISAPSFCGSCIGSVQIREFPLSRRFCIRDFPGAVNTFRFTRRQCLAACCLFQFLCGRRINSRLAQCISHRRDQSHGTVCCSGNGIHIRALFLYDSGKKRLCAVKVSGIIFIGNHFDRSDFPVTDNYFHRQFSAKSDSGSIVGAVLICRCILHFRHISGSLRLNRVWRFTVIHFTCQCIFYRIDNSS